MSSVENVTMIETLCRHWGASLFGVAAIGALKGGDLLLSQALIDQHPFAISIGYHLSDAVVSEIEDRPTPLYFQHYQRVNILLDTIGLMLNNAIQDLGYQAVPIPASQIVDWQNQRAHLSHKHVAQAAGLGWIGKNNLLINERYGARIRLLTVLTSLPLQVNSPSTRDCGTCSACLSACPVGAIRDKKATFDHLRCFEQLKVFSKTLKFSHHICGICVKACPPKVSKALT